MLKGKLIQLLQRLDRKEMTRFVCFVHSPYFNKHKKVKDLVEYLSTIFPHFDTQNTGKESIFTHLFPGEEFDKNKLAVLFTYTQRLAEEFLSVEWMMERKNTLEQGLLIQLREKKEYKWYEKKLDKIIEDRNKERIKNANDFLEMYLLAKERDIYFDQREKRQNDASLQKKHDLLDYFYLAEKFRDACEMQVRSHILKIEYSTRFIDQALREIEENLERYSAEPVIFMYYNIFKMLSQREALQYYHDAYKYLREKEKHFSRSDLKELYNYLQNYCIEKINKGQKKFLKEIFLLYKSQLDNELLIEGKYLSEWHYKNIVTVAIHLQEMKWVKCFIEDYKSKLQPGSVENAYRFNMATYYYAVGNYDQVKQLLSEVEYSDQRYSLGTKALLLRTYYELDEVTPLVSLTDSFRQYLLRNKLMADQKRKGYYNSFKLTKKAALIRANSTFNTKERSAREISQLEESIKNTSNILNRPWLLQKIAELKEEIGI